MTTDSRDKLSQDERVTARLSGGPPAGDLDAAAVLPDLSRNAPTVLAQRRVAVEPPPTTNDELFDEELGTLLGPSLLVRFGRLALWAAGGALLAVAVWYGVSPLFEGEAPPRAEVSAAQPAREPAPARAVPAHDPPPAASVRTEKPVSSVVAVVPAEAREGEARREAGKGARAVRRTRPTSEALPASGLAAPRAPREERVASPATEPAPGPGVRDFTRPMAPLAD